MDTLIQQTISKKRQCTKWIIFDGGMVHHLIEIQLPPPWTWNII